MAAFLLLVGLLFAVRLRPVPHTSTALNTVGPDGSIRPLRTSDWFDVPHHMARRGKRGR